MSDIGVRDKLVVSCASCGYSLFEPERTVQIKLLCDSALSKETGLNSGSLKGDHGVWFKRTGS